MNIERIASRVALDLIALRSKDNKWITHAFKIPDGLEATFRKQIPITPSQSPDSLVQENERELKGILEKAGKAVQSLKVKFAPMSSKLGFLIADIKETFGKPEERESFVKALEWHPMIDVQNARALHASLTAAEKYLKKDGSELLGKELRFVKEVAVVMNRPWQAIAARPRYTDAVMEAMKRGDTPDEAADYIKAILQGVPGPSVRMADAWVSEASKLEKVIGKAVAQNANRIISVSQDGEGAECSVYSGELVTAAREELKLMGWRIDDLSPAAFYFGLSRIK